MAKKRKIFEIPRLTAVIHLPPLAGTPTSRVHPADALDLAGARAVKEAVALERAGFDALILENFGDMPFFKTRVPPETVASMAIIASAIRDTVKIPVGINVLRNDARAAVAIASVAGLQFVRVNVLSGVVATDQGLIQGQASVVQRYRERLGSNVAVFADVHVKHGVTLSSTDPVLAAEETFLRSGAHAVILSGPATGHPLEIDELRRVYRGTRRARIPILVGSGVGVENAPAMLQHAHGIIVSSSLRKNGRAGADLETPRLRKFVQACKLKRGNKRNGSATRKDHRPSV